MTKKPHRCESCAGPIHEHEIGYPSTHGGV